MKSLSVTLAALLVAGGPAEASVTSGSTMQGSQAVGLPLGNHTAFGQRLRERRALRRFWRESQEKWSDG